MEYYFAVLLILTAILVGAASPGPSFILVARSAIGTSRNNGIATSIGMGIGATIFSILSLVGLHAVLTSVPMLYVSFKILGGLYLIYMGVCIWRGASEPMAVENESVSTDGSYRRSFLVGLITQVSNPKTAIVYGSIFAALLPSDIPNIIYFILPPLVFLVEAGWYLVVTLLLSTAKPRAVYIRSKAVFDRTAGIVMAGLGLRLISSTGSQ